MFLLFITSQFKEKIFIYIKYGIKEQGDVNKYCLKYKGRESDIERRNIVFNLIQNEFGRFYSKD